MKVLASQPHFYTLSLVSRRFILVSAYKRIYLFRPFLSLLRTRLLFTSLLCTVKIRLPWHGEGLSKPKSSIANLLLFFPDAY
jgi:hypothetical protein